MYSLSGTFGPWALEVTEYDPVWLPEASFHIYEKVEGSPEYVKTLSTNKVIKPAWDKLKIGEAKYYALQHMTRLPSISLQFLAPRE